MEVKTKETEIIEKAKKEGQVIELKLNQIKPYPNNAKIHTEKQVGDIRDSIITFGYLDYISVDENNVILAGHGRLQAFYQIDTSGTKQIKVLKITHLNDDEKKAYRIAHNKLSLSTGLDNIKLSTEFNSLEDTDSFNDTGFSTEEITEIWEEVNPTETKEDNFEIPKDPKYMIEQGEIWQLGDHRLMCGDANNRTEGIGMLLGSDKITAVITDPPYNTGMSEKKNCDSTRLNHMFNDSFTDEEWDKFLNRMCETIHFVMPMNSVAYIFHDWRGNYKLIPKIKKHLKLSNLIVWDKVVHGLGSDYQYTHEFINVCKKGKPKLNTHQDQEYQDVWHIQRKVGKNELHATAKPVELISRLIRHCSKESDSILDLFGGSGTTLIACEQLKRKCYMMELDPKYCSVIIERWEKLTGKEAKKLT